MKFPVYNYFIVYGNSWNTRVE